MQTLKDLISWVNAHRKLAAVGLAALVLCFLVLAASASEKEVHVDAPCFTLEELKQGFSTVFMVIAARGAFEYVYRMDCATPVGLAYKCPCGCGYEGYQYLSKGGDKTHWHGWLRDGVWQAC